VTALEVFKTKIKIRICGFFIHKLVVKNYQYIAHSNEILGWGGVGNRQLLCFFKA
jgi:hypothetical protein